MAQIPGDYNKTRPDYQQTEVLKCGEAIAEGDLISHDLVSGDIVAMKATVDGDNWDGVALTSTTAAGQQVRYVIKGYVPKLACSGSVVAGSQLDSNGNTTAGSAVTPPSVAVARLRALTAISSGFCEAWIR